MWRYATEFIHKPYNYKIHKENTVKPKQRKIRLEKKVSFKTKIVKKNIEIIF